MSTRTTVQITMPQMGESVTEGTILEWRKQVGDSVEQDEPLVDVSTDKVDTEVPSPATGTLVRILAEADETVPVGTVIGEIAVGDGGAPAPAAPAGENGTATTGGAEPQAPGRATDEDAPEGGEPAALVDLVFPQMGDSVAEGTVLEWRKQVGDPVEAEETVVEISTDKVDAEVPAPVAGTIVEILAQPDETVPTGAVLARIAPSAAGARAAGGGAQPPREASAPTEGQRIHAGNGDANATPVAARIASAHGLDVASVPGSGPRGRVTKSDVLAALEGDGRAAAPPAAEAPKSTPLRGPAAMLAKLMDESRSIPTATSFRTIEVDELDRRRRMLKDAGRRLSFTHLIAWAIVEAAREMPVMAHAYAEVDGKPQRVEPASVSLGIAVDVERKDGSRSLVVPVIKAASELDFPAFVERYDELVAGARDNTLPPAAYQGANISLTNPGGIGTVASVPRLMPGQGTIVATGAIGYPPGFQSADPARLRELGVSKVMTMTSTYDHRIIQGAESGAFLRRIDQLLQGEDGFYERVFGALGGPPSDGAGPITAAEPAPSAITPAVTGKPDEALLQAVQAATSVVKAHRMHGHLAARLDPLGSEPVGDPALDPATVNLTPELMRAIPASVLRVAVPGETFADALPHLQETYCGTIAYEIEHISDHEQRVWLRQTIESGQHRQPLSDEEKRALLERLSAVEALETYLHKAFLGRKQFSIEGLDMLVPMLDAVMDQAAEAGAREVVIGMAHRGRLNVLAHTVGRPYESILVEFEGEASLDADTAKPEEGTGDVKYHYGASGTYRTRSGKGLTVTLSPNPSHLEYVNPVIEGRARADQTSRAGRQALHDPTAVLPLLIHGDAAFPGQGVVAETLNLQALEGYSTGGTVHIIANNQLGFTTDPEEGRSTRYASDLAKGFDIPIVHVNADDVEACIAAVRLAMEFRRRFGRDALIDLIGYRRYGHNETDEPAYTQPQMYDRIKKHPPVRKLYAERLIEEGVVTKEEADRMAADAYQKLVDAHNELKASMSKSGPDTGEFELDRSASAEPRTTVPADTLISLNEQLLKVPEGFNLHRKLKPQIERRRQSIQDGTIDWAQAEALAWASLLQQGVPIRLTGQDSERGTFSQRHLVFHDAKTGARHAPIQQLPNATAPFELHNSPLSEVACLGFEYGYSVQAPDALVLWEAQFGDFVNSAEVIVDQFIVSGLAKWGLTSRLTLLLPHGYEGSGPEHSSGRVERFLQLAAEGNIRVANCTTPAQYFHLLRRQALVSKRRPLVVMTPKSLLRLPAATSRLEDLSEGAFQPVLDDPTLPGSREEVTRLVLCSGKVYYDIVSSEQRPERREVAVGRVELLYPFAENEIAALIASYPNVREVVWVQEEPQNMGARGFMKPRLEEMLPEGVAFGYVGRELRASPGEGYTAAHRAEQQRIVRAALRTGG
ncbi:MAG: multifunctional oxoglutarate decarboxylase/oxoglutarate dehydrogenase thiamine pyrophosphate-binding subunit/dihydrolipoyllysine-residue succinyltransferase subunit [Thermoleophilaceae bacterium]|nr:multifunctional oxoglutarate decarboxylase/oxoglutarate dehydrogenase thiamine pyrophosphate-binding subunit/dihydrolipoyllysine-residue succinyltransferase subunit [Thermoleophilaceae bacterium]